MAILLHKTPKEIRESVSPVEAEQIAFVQSKQAALSESRQRANQWLSKQGAKGKGL